MSSITVQPELLLERDSHHGDRPRDRARRGLRCAPARAGQGKSVRSGRRRCDAARIEQAADRRHRRDRRRRTRRSADAVHRREGRQQAGPKVDIAVDPLEGTTLCAKNMPGSIATLAMADGGTLLHAADVYMDKIAIGPGYPKGTVDLDAPAEENILVLAKAKGVKPQHITAHAARSAAPRRHHRGGAQDRRSVTLITDGDVAGVIHCAEPKTGIDIYLGIGGAPEGVLSAAALRCIGGQMQTRLILDTEERRERASKMGIKDSRKKYEIEDMVRGDCLFAATGVTTGPMLQGVKFNKDTVETETVVMRSVTGTVRRVYAEHREIAKFHLD